MTSDEPLGRTRPLCFLHVPKTGGVSLTDALARRFPAEQVFLAPDGNLSLANLEALGARLDGPLFLAGHPVMGFVPALTGRADIITVLRHPRDQIVSLYLHILAGPQNPLHAAAIRQPFPDFLRENIGLLTFQTTSLALALSAATPAGPDQVLDFLDGLPFVGVIERPETCADVLTRLVAADPPLELPNLNAAPSTLSWRLSRHGEKPGARLRRFARRSCLRRSHRHRNPHLRAGGGPPGPARGGPAPCAAGRRRPRARRSHRSLAVPRPRRTPERRRDPPRHQRRIQASDFRSLRAPAARPLRRAVLIWRSPALMAAESRSTSLPTIASLPRAPALAAPAAADWSAGRLTLGFFNPDPANVLEFRVRADRCAAGELTFRGVTIRPARLAQTWPSLIARGLRKLRVRGGGGRHEFGASRPHVSAKPHNLRHPARRTPSGVRRCGTQRRLAMRM